MRHTEEKFEFSEIDSFDFLLVDIFAIDRMLQAVHSFHFSKVEQVGLSLLVESKQLLSFVESDDVIESLFGAGVEVYVSAVIKQAIGSLLIFSFGVEKA